MPLVESQTDRERAYPSAGQSTSISEIHPKSATSRERALQVALVLVGVTFIVGIYTLVVVWPSGWAWHAGQSHHLPHYLQMILGVYATLGVFLLIASRRPASGHGRSQRPHRAEPIQERLPERSRRRYDDR